MARRHNSRRVKNHRQYTIEEAAKLLGVHKHTVSRWIQRGLPIVERKRPYLILGEDLRAFLAQQAPAPKRCQPDEFYCVKCRTPRPPAEGMVDTLTQDHGRPLLCAICEKCGTLMHRFSKAAHASRQQHLVDTAGPDANVAFGAPQT